MKPALRTLLAVCVVCVTVAPAPKAAPVPVDRHVDLTVSPRTDAVVERRLDVFYFTVAATTTTTAPPVEGNTRAMQQQQENRVPSSGVWDRIAACESGGNWATNTGNSYYGGLQEDMQFWRSYGGLEFAARPDLASRAQQIVVAERARDSGRGYTPWPQCGARG